MSLTPAIWEVLPVKVYTNMSLKVSSYTIVRPILQVSVIKVCLKVGWAGSCQKFNVKPTHMLVLSSKSGSINQWIKKYILHNKWPLKHFGQRIITFINILVQYITFSFLPFDVLTLAGSSRDIGRSPLWKQRAKQIWEYMTYDMRLKYRRQQSTGVCRVFTSPNHSPYYTSWLSQCLPILVRSDLKGLVTYRCSNAFIHWIEPNYLNWKMVVNQTFLWMLI